MASNKLNYRNEEEGQVQLQHEDSIQLILETGFHPDFHGFQYIPQVADVVFLLFPKFMESVFKLILCMKQVVFDGRRIGFRLHLIPE
jgi:hypothetical protein